jgi:hypothetical protein
MQDVLELLTRERDQALATLTQHGIRLDSTINVSVDRLLLMYKIVLFKSCKIWSFAFPIASTSMFIMNFGFKCFQK